MSDFNSAFSKTIGVEGVYQNNSSDKGNYNSASQLIGTKFGISAPTLETYIQRVPSVSDMKNLTLEQAKAIYKKYYWDFYKIGTIQDEYIANHVFDLLVNMSPVDATDIVQDAINLTLPYYIVNDKKIGANTIATINKITSAGRAKELNANIYNERKKKYLSFGGEFVAGWLNRADKFKDYIISQKKSSIAIVLAAGLALYLLLRK